MKKLAEIREEDLVNLYAEEIKIHIGHIEDVEGIIKKHFLFSLTVMGVL